MPVFFPIKQIRESISVKETSKRINNYLSAVFLYKIYFLLMIVLNLVFLFINEIERGRMKVKLRYKMLWGIIWKTHELMLLSCYGGIEETDKHYYLYGLFKIREISKENYRNKLYEQSLGQRVLIRNH